MPGRSRTGSRPSSTVMSSASSEAGVSPAEKPRRLTPSCHPHRRGVRSHLPERCPSPRARPSNDGERTRPDALALGRAVVLHSGLTAPRALVIRDTRESGEMLEAALAAGIASAGGEVALGGVLPTPAAPLLIRRHELRPRGRDLRLPQSLRGQRDQVLRQRRLQALRRDRAGDRAAHRRGRRRRRDPDRADPRDARDLRRLPARARVAILGAVARRAGPRRSTAPTAPPSRSRRRSSAASAPP